MWIKREQRFAVHPRANRVEGCGRCSNCKRRPIGRMNGCFGSACGAMRSTCLRSTSSTGSLGHPGRWAFRGPDRISLSSMGSSCMVATTEATRDEREGLKDPFKKPKGDDLHSWQGIAQSDVGMDIEVSDRSRMGTFRGVN